MYLHLCAINTNSGNPRRLYAKIVTNLIIKAYDEGYSGHHCVPEADWKQASRAIYIEVTPKEYKRILKEFEK